MRSFCDSNSSIGLHDAFISVGLHGSHRWLDSGAQHWLALLHSVLAFSVAHPVSMALLLLVVRTISLILAQTWLAQAP